MSLKCIVVDDEELARLLLSNFIEKVPDLELVAQCKNPMEASQVMNREPVDLLFLDIQMPELTGLEFLGTLAEKPMVVFTTAYAQHAIEAFNLHVLDYLLKPFSFQRFLQAVNKAQNQYRLAALDKKGQTHGLSPLPKQGSMDYLLVKADYKLHKVPLQDIIYIQSQREYVSYHLKQGQLMALNSLKRLEEELPEDRFTRIHKSYLVANQFVSSLEGNRLHVGEAILPVGAMYKEALLKRLFS